MSDKNDAHSDGQRHCPMCGSAIDDGTMESKSTGRRILLAATLMPLGVIAAVGGRLLAYYTDADALGYITVGAGGAVTLLSGYFVFLLD